MSGYTRIGAIAAITLVAPFLLFAGAHADVVISANPTQNMVCSGGVCAPTAADAVLNTSDLQNLLASGNVDVVTSNGGIQANNIDVAAAFTWSSATNLALDAYQSITLTAKVTDGGNGGVSLTTNDGGSGGLLSFFGAGRLTFTFHNLKDSLLINGVKYKLASNIRNLAYAIVKDPAGAYALADNYDARKDGVYRSPPVPVAFTGSFNGLGHVISKLEIGDSADSYVGFFYWVSGTVSSIGLRNVVVRGSAEFNATGGLVGALSGTMSNSWTSGIVDGSSAGGGGYAAGGLVGSLDFGGAVSNSWSSAQVANQYGYGAGGLVGQAYEGGAISGSFATGNVSSYYCAGGLFGSPQYSGPTIANSYATGAIGGNLSVTVGGLAGCTGNSSLSADYSTGSVTGASGAYVGGFIGENSNSTATNCYWDTTTSGTNIGVGSGSNAGITGLTSQQLQSGLPAGFDPTIWAEDPSINSGFPYLIANPPQQ